MPETFRKPRPEWLLLSLLMLAGCGDSRLPISLPFEASYLGRPVDCESAAVRLNDLRLYISEVTAVMTDGQQIGIAFIPDTDWQNDTVALIDLESGNGACRDGTPETNHELQLLWPEGEVRQLKLTVGVPFDDNHADPLAAAAPLDDSAMHWHWRSGYKFLRAGVEVDGDSFWLHLGSTGCEGTTGDIRACNAPNRVTLTLEGFVAGRSAAVIHLDRLFAGIDLSDGVPSDCSSGPFETDCDAALANLGLAAGSAMPWLTLEPR